MPGQGTLVSFEAHRKSDMDASFKLRRRRITTVATEEADVRRGYDWPGQSSHAHIAVHHVHSPTPCLQLAIPSRPVLPPQAIAQAQSARLLASPEWWTRAAPVDPAYVHDGYLSSSSSSLFSSHHRPRGGSFSSPRPLPVLCGYHPDSRRPVRASDHVELSSYRPLMDGYHRAHLSGRRLAYPYLF